MQQKRNETKKKSYFQYTTIFVTLYWLSSVVLWSVIFVMCFASLYAGAVLLFITGLIGIPSLCSFSCALSIGGDG